MLVALLLLSNGCLEVFPASVMTSCKVSDASELRYIFCHFSVTSCCTNVKRTVLYAIPSMCGSRMAQL